MTTGSVATGTAATVSVATGTVPISAAALGGAAIGNDMPTDITRGVNADARARDDSKQLRDIEELVAKLAIVTKQLAFPARTVPSPGPADAGQPAAHEN
jgi:hypothetical protein